MCDENRTFFSLKEDGTYFAKLFSFPTRLVSSADNFCKHFGPRSKMSGRSKSKAFDSMMVFLKDFFECVDFEK